MQLGAHGDAKTGGRKGACNDLERLQFQNVPMVVLLLFYCAHGYCLSVIALTSRVKITEREKTVFITATGYIPHLSSTPEKLKEIFFH